VSADPRLENAARRNFHLCPGSAAIDNGTAVGLALPPADFDGQPRVQDGDGDGVAIVDIGALEAAAPGALTLRCATSRKVHGPLTFDLPLSLIPINPATEPRTGPAQTIVLTFSKPVVAATLSITEGTATAGTSTISANDVVVDLTGVEDRQYVTISLTNVAALDGSTGGTGLLRIGFLAGDVNQNRVVSVADLGIVNAQLAMPVTWANFLKDVNASGALSVADKGIANANLAKALPAP
jgi:hypothetical protein